MQVQINRNVLAWIFRQCRNMVISEKNMTLLQKWMDEKKIPTFNQVEAVSKATGIPFGYFFLKEPPLEDMPILEYRTVDSIEAETPSRNLMDTVHDMELVQDWVVEDLLKKGMDPLPYVGALNEDSDIYDFAKYCRKILAIDMDWFHQNKNTNESFKYIRNAISNAGITVMLSGIVGNNTRRTLSINEFRAFALVDRLAPLIFINNHDSESGKLFSLLHEFNHILLGKSSFYNDYYGTQSKVNKTETLCNAVAAEVLVPYELFLREWEKKPSLKEGDKIVTLARAFRCGTVVIARRALDAGLITQKTYKETVNTAITIFEKQNKSGKNSGGDYYKTLASKIDSHFLTNLLNSVKSGQTLYSDAFRLTNTNQSTFDKLIAITGDDLI